MLTSARSAASAGNAMYPATVNLSASIRIGPVAAGISYASKRRASTFLAYVVGSKYTAVVRSASLTTADDCMHRRIILYVNRF